MELNVPEGAFPEGTAVKLKISKATRQEAMPQEPDLPGFHFGSAIRIESEGWDAPLPEGREIDITFPRPDFSVLPESERPTKPEDVHYWVIRKMVKDDGTVMYETLDYADPDPASGAGLSGSRIKTASFPFVGLASPASTASLGGFLGPVLLGAVAVQHVILMWYVDKLIPARATQGVLNGRVFRQVYKAGQAESSTEGIAAVLVSEAEVIPGSNPVQYRLLAAEATATGPVVATTQGSGMFTGTIPRFDAGQKLYGANVGGVVYVGSTYQVVRNDSKTQSSPQLLNLFNAGFSNNVAYVDINLPAVTAPAAAPQIEIRLLDISSTPRRALSNVVVTGEPVRFGFRTRSLTATPDPTPGVNRADITGPSGADSITLQVDPLKASSPTSPLAYDQISNDDFVPGTPGTYTITAVRTPAFGSPIQETYTFRAISPGGSIKTSVPGRPGVLADQTKPRRDGRGQPITVAPQLVFSEPVTNVPGNVRLKDAAGNVVPVRISAIALDVNGDDIVIPDLQSSTAKVTGLTLEPLANLRYGNTYTLSLTEAIVDLDTPEAQALVPYSTSFTTFSPEELGGSETKPIVAGIAVLGERAYAAETNYAGGIGGASQSGNLVTFDVTDPSLPLQVDPKVAIPFPPRDIAAEETMVDGTDASGQPTQVSRRTVAVVSQPRTYYKVEGELVFYTSIVSSPSNLFVYDVTDPSVAPKWVGAASISANLDDGTPSRMKVKGNKAYVGMFGRGIVVAELDQAKNGFPNSEAPAVGTPARRDLDLALNQGGVNRSAAAMVCKIVDPFLGSATDPRVDNAPASRSLPVIDLDVADMVVNGSVQRIVLATSMRREAALILATGTDPYPLVRRAIPGMLVSSAVALTKVDGHDLAIVGGFMDGKWGIATIDLSPLAAPIPTDQQPPELPTLWFTEIPDLTGIGDIEMLGTTAVVTSQVGIGNATLIDINVTTPPVISGTIDGVASRVAVSDKVLFSADGRVFVPGAGTSDTLHGVKAAALGTFAVVRRVSENPVILDIARKSIEPQEVVAGILPRVEPQEVRTARIEIVNMATDQVLQTYPVSVNAMAEATITIPEGLSHPQTANLGARMVAELEDGTIPQTGTRRLQGEQFTVLPSTPETIELDGDPVDIIATNRAITGRLTRARTEGEAIYHPPNLSWAVSGTPGGAVAPIAEAPPTGVYSTEARTSGTAGQAHIIELRRGPSVLARSAPLTIEPGEGVRADPLSATLPAPANTAVTEIPADGTTKIVLTLSQIKDRAGNLVANGTPVSWQVGSDDGGEFIAAETQFQTANGQARATYRAGIEAGAVPLEAELDGRVFPITITQAELDVVVAMSGTAVTVTALSTAGPAAPGTPVRFALLGARVDGADTLGAGGIAQGTWVQTNPERNRGSEEVIVNIGRARGRTQLDRLALLPPTEPRLSLDHENLMGDRIGPLVLNGAENTSVEIPSATTMRFQGAPNAPVTLLLGSMKNPAYQPQAEFALDVQEAANPSINEPARTPDAYLGAAMTLSATSRIVYTEEGGRGRGGLMIDRDPASITNLGDLRTNFGFNLYFNLSQVEERTKLIERIGSFAIQTVTLGASTVLEFSVMSGGVKKRVLSTQALAAATWYHVSAHFRDGALKVQVDSEPPQTEETSGPADASTLPVLVGAELTGYVDMLRVYDFSRQPLFTFANGQETVDVATDANGDASAEVVGSGAMRTSGMDPFGSATYARTGESDSGPSANETLQDPSPSPQASPAQPVVIDAGFAIGEGAFRAQVFRAQIWGYATRQLSPESCFEALLTAEPATLIGWVCELGVGFTAAGGFAQGGRDLTLAYVNFTQSKKDRAAYTRAAIEGGLAVVGIVPGVRALGAVGEAVQRGSKVSKVVADDMVDAMRRAASDAPPRIDVNISVYGVLGNVNDPALRQSAEGLLNGFKNSGAAQEALDRIAKSGVMNAEQMVGTLVRLKATGRFSSDVLERVVGAIDQMPGLGAINPNAVEGMAVFARGYGDSAGGALTLSWKTIKGVSEFKQGGVLIQVSPEQLARIHTESMDVFYSRLKVIADTRPGDIAKFAGQIKSMRGCDPAFALNKFKGAFHQLEQTLEFGLEKADLIDADAKHLGYFGRPDWLSKADTSGLRIEAEFKNITEWGNRDLRQLDGKVGKLRGRVGDQARALVDELGRMQYRVRGPITPNLKEVFEKRVEQALLKAGVGDDIVKKVMEEVREGRVPDLLKSSGKRTPF